MVDEFESEVVKVGVGGHRGIKVNRCIDSLNELLSKTRCGIAFTYPAKDVEVDSLVDGIQV